MSIQMTSGDGFTRGMQRQYDPVVLYDDTDGMAFGPTFDDRREAAAFVRWFEHHLPPTRSGGQYPLTLAWSDFRFADYGKQKAIADEWRKLLSEHDEQVCPFDDRESYGVGYSGESDRSYGDSTEARPDRCECECHLKALARELTDEWGEKQREKLRQAREEGVKR